MKVEGAQVMRLNVSQNVRDCRGAADSMLTRLRWMLLATGVAGIVIAAACSVYSFAAVGWTAPLRVIPIYPASLALRWAPTVLVLVCALLVLAGRQRDYIAAGLGVVLVGAYYALSPWADRHAASSGSIREVGSVIALLAAATLVVSIVAVIEGASIREALEASTQPDVSTSG